MKKKSGTPWHLTPEADARPMSLIERAYRYFRAHGATPKGALHCARVEIRAEEAGLTVTAEPEVESYKSVYGEDPPKGVEFYCLMVCAPDDEHDVLASLGFVSGDSYSIRVEGVAVLDEALWELDERARKEADREATLLRAIDSVAATL